MDVFSKFLAQIDVPVVKEFGAYMGQAGLIAAGFLAFYFVFGIFLILMWERKPKEKKGTHLKLVHSSEKVSSK